MFYAPQLFESVGHGADAALQATVITGAVNVVSTIVAIVAVDRLGRRLLFLQGGAQMIACQVIIGALIKLLFSGGAAAAGSEALTGAIIAFICVYVVRALIVFGCLFLLGNCGGGGGGAVAAIETTRAPHDKLAMPPTHTHTGY
jgi:hypothetical protein